MGAAGSAWIKPKKRSGLRPESIRQPAHPRVLRAGQRFFPLTGSKGVARAPLQVVRLRPGGEHCDARRDDRNWQLVRCSVARLLAIDDQGDGCHYRFVGFAPRTYDTHALVVGVDGPWARLILPEWHDALAVTSSARALPDELREFGRWLSCRANLGADNPAKVMPTRFGSPRRDFRPELLPTPVLPEAGTELRDEPRPTVGEGCGDIVLFLDRASATTVRDGLADVYVNGHTPPVAAGDRVYIHDGNVVLGWRAVERRAPTPQGTRLSFAEEWHMTRVATDVRRPVAGVAEGGSHGQQAWTWRSWSRAAEGAS